MIDTYKDVDGYKGADGMDKIKEELPFGSAANVQNRYPWADSHRDLHGFE